MVAESSDISKEDPVSRWPMHQSKIQCVALGRSQSRVSQGMAGESYPADTFIPGGVSVSYLCSMCLPGI